MGGGPGHHVPLGRHVRGGRVARAPGHNVCPGKKPWSLTFSYGRALQQSVLKAWKGSDANIAAAQKELMIRSKANSEANLGTYKGGAGGAAATASTFVANYS